jgi:predicted HicB family RNase H-like nuclease
LGIEITPHENTNTMRYGEYVCKITHYDNVMETFHGECWVKPDLLAVFQGTSVEELRASFHEAVDDALQYDKEENSNGVQDVLKMDLY